MLVTGYPAFAQKELMDSFAARDSIDVTPRASEDVTVRGSLDFPIRESVDSTVRGSVNIAARKSLDQTIRASTDTRLEFKRTSMDSDKMSEIIEKEIDSGQTTPVEEFLNWSGWYKWYLNMLGGLLGFVTTFASSAPSGYATDLLAKFHLDAELDALVISLFVMGFCVGPLLWAPLSEQYGRRPILIISFLGFTAFQIACPFATHFGAIAAFRFLGGVFSASTQPIAPYFLHDSWDDATREKALIVQAILSFIGPTIGPLVSGYMAAANIDWKWCFWMLAIMTGTCTLLIILTYPETYRPILLTRKAKRLRKETGDVRYQAPLELVQSPKLSGRLHDTLAKPFIMFLLEPMLIATTMYLAFLGGCLYMLLEAYPVVFQEGYHFSSSTLALTYLPVTAGNFFALALHLWVIQPEYEREVKAYAPNPVPPEERLWVAVWAAPLFAITFLWFGWTSFPTINFWVPMMSGFVMGCTMLLLMVAMFNYIVDVYAFAAASALSSSMAIRNVFGAVFPLFSTQMYRALDPRWASTLVGCVAIVAIPIPIVLKRYGPAFRAKSRYHDPVRII
ncbi:MFS general substrate transporter [Dichomitus squalens]|uniref:MFS general substrate transporter n=1 Tax=Dichomitus squalens TaxID=114155 RepID=A0A4Q9Q216_9APHY|nr:MFS general substrate transporter [Dichomitus squalens]